MDRFVASVADMLALGEALGRVAPPGTTLALHGALGTGKTVLVKGIARGLGVDPATVASPTFPLILEHPGGRVPLVHVDLYRLQTAEDVEQLGLEEQGEGVLAVEWAERGPHVLWDDRLEVTLTAEGAGRRVRVEARGPRADAVLALWAGALGG